jgi:hypothetical protein
VPKAIQRNRADADQVSDYSPVIRKRSFDAVLRAVPGTVLKAMQVNRAEETQMMYQYTNNSSVAMPMQCLEQIL